MATAQILFNLGVRHSNVFTLRQAAGLILDVARAYSGHLPYTQAFHSKLLYVVEVG